MIKKYFFSLIAPIIFFISGLSFGDVLYVYDCVIDEYIVGQQKGKVYIGYTDSAMYYDKVTSYEAGIIRRFLGGVQKNRKTTFFLLDKDVVREIDYGKGRILEFSFGKLTDPAWYNKRSFSDISAPVKKVITDRYKTTKPDIRIKKFPKKEKINGYLCERIDARLELQTIDKLKNAASITIVTQNMWLTDTVPGFEEYKKFHRNMGKRLGIDAGRLGNLSGILSYKQGSLNNIKETLKGTDNFLIKNIITVQAIYKTEKNTTEKIISQTQETLSDVICGSLDKKRFLPPEEYPVVGINK